ncbi:MAG TPA: prepilin peptidase [Thermoanaerobaculia bacterium]|nr:prepilin peptidase [Thermoanaerobaculia bacterium]HUM31042.1 prepilin peptidase [Thermoanaerobaculia bacterium]HXK69340.1 prepilin peptidase [Thermoanaerobaculia bacterium]
MPTLILYLYGLLLGAVIGSFLNVCIHRLPKGESLIRPRSHCPGCKTPILVRHNIPIVSYIVLRGRCPSCGMSISWQYPLVECLTAAAGIGSVYAYGFSVQALTLFLFSCMMIVGVGTDVREKILPDEITLGGTLIGIGLAWAGASVPLLSALWGGLTGSLLFLGLLLGYYLLRGHHGMGFGDVKIMALIGVFLGFPKVLSVVLLGSLLGLIWGLGLILLRQKSFKYALPFGAFLGVAALLILYLDVLWPGMVKNAIPF